MRAADQLRNSIINKLLTISKVDYLSALSQLIEKSREKRKMLVSSEADQPIHEQTYLSYLLA